MCAVYVYCNALKLIYVARMYIKYACSVFLIFHVDVHCRIFTHCPIGQVLVLYMTVDSVSFRSITLAFSFSLYPFICAFSHSLYLSSVCFRSYLIPRNIFCLAHRKNFSSFNLSKFRYKFVNRRLQKICLWLNDVCGKAYELFISHFFFLALALSLYFSIPLWSSMTPHM